MSSSTSAAPPLSNLFEQSLREKARTAEVEGQREASLVMSKIGGVLDPRIAALAREIAQDIHGIDEILRRHGFTGEEDERWQNLTRNAEFNRLLAEQIREWASADSTPARITLKAQAAVENGIPSMFALMEDPTESGANRAKAFELLSKLGKVMTDPAAAAMAAGGGKGGLNLRITLTTRTGERQATVIDQNGAKVPETPETAIDVEFIAAPGSSQFFLGAPVLED